MVGVCPSAYDSSKSLSSTLGWICASNHGWTSAAPLGRHSLLAIATDLRERCGDPFSAITSSKQRLVPARQGRPAQRSGA
jgi:hypothetical protein